MKHKFLKPLAVATSLLISTTAMSENPFFQPFNDTPHNVTPFDKIQNSDYEEAILRGIKLGKEEINAICANPEKPTFENTIVALEDAGEDLDRVLNVFYNLAEAMSSDEVMAIQERIIPVMSEYSTSITLNEDLWKRIKAVHDTADTSKLSVEDKRLLDDTYDDFVRSGALLQGEDRETFRKLQTRLSELNNKFSQNVLRELNTYEIWLTANDLDGLPASQVEAAAFAAEQKGRKGEYLFTLEQPTYMAFMKYSSRRDLRERFYRLYNGRNTKGEFSNLEIMREIANTRLAIAKLLGYKSYADYSLVHTMAGKPERVYDLLNRLTEAYRPAWEKEFANLKAFAAEKEGHAVDLQPWDYSYYANLLRQRDYAFDEEALRPYFELDNTIGGVFGLATKLYGVTFRENKNLPIYHPDVKAYEVLDDKGEYMGVIYTDFFPRSSKRPGAWMTDFKGEWQDKDGKVSHPHVSLVMNFTKPTGDTPSLLTPYEVETFLHEFGHALHGLMASTKYKSLSGTNVYRDFVELPSQFNENFLYQREFLDGFARHYKTDEPIPAAEVQKIIDSAQFGAAYACLRQLNFGLVDMAWHSITEPLGDDVDLTKFELDAGKAVAMFPAVEGTLFSPQFNHIFSGGYAAGYYSYKWAEVLDADAFSVFLKNGIFDQESAKKFRDNVLSQGGTVDPAELYRRFRGQDPTIDALLERDGIKPVAETKKLPEPLNRKD
ncbi:MAG: M3 family metallopeptidase [Muribaculaceae bacterium]|nr:M3 family metallopeptidase [Muribaculaceae bacterium]